MQNTLSLRAISPIKILLAISILAIFSSCSTSKPSEQASTFLWEVRQKSDQNKVMYLLGSIHFATKSMYPLKPVIMTAWEKSDVLGVEMNIEDLDLESLSSNLSLIMKIMDFTEKLSDKLPPDLYVKVEKKLQEVGLPEEVIDMMTPLGAALMLDMGGIIAQMQDTTNSELTDGIDQYFLKLAKDKQKTIVEVEGLEKQIGFLEQLNEFIIEYIKVLVLEEENSGTIGETDNFALFNVWKNGDVDYVAKQMEQMSSDKVMNEKLKNILIYSRNKAMTEKLEEYFNDSKTYFIVIGAGHYVGEQSIIDILEKTGKYDIIRR